MNYKLLRNIVSILGPIYGNEKYDIISKCNIFVHTSRYEGMPIAVLEALSIGTPCFVTAGTNMAGIINESGAGFTSDNSVTGIREALEKIMDTSDLELKKMGESGKKWAIKNLQWKDISRVYENHYMKLI